MDRAFQRAIRAAVEGETKILSRLLETQPELATRQLKTGATRQRAAEFFIREIAHYLYAGDTALHAAAAAFQRPAARVLVERGATCRARNRRGAEPLHYAADANHWKPAAQRETIEYLLSIGADPNAIDKSGVAPLHRAVRTRSSQAVSALLAGGANPTLKNGSGSTPLHLAVQTTGRGGSGLARARNEQRTIIGLLLDAGAKAADTDAKGKTVLDAASHEWIRTLLREA
jgi:ankyrin repeat protein